MAAPVLLLPDLSEFQASADMGGIKRQNGGAAIVRLAYGDGHDDATGIRLRKDAAKAGFRFLGLYMYLVAGQSVLAQAERFVQLAGKLAPHEIPVVDVEEGAGSQLSRARAWLSYVDQHLGLSGLPLHRRSWLYTGESFASSANLLPIVRSGRHAWIAAYGDTEPSLGQTLWQCTDGRTGSHITSWPGAGKCDTSVFNGTLAELAALINPAGAATAPGLLLEETMPILLNRGAGSKTPIALPDNTKSVRFYSNTDAQLLVDVRDGKAERTVTLAYGSAKSVDIPKGVHAIVVHRVDDEGNNVSCALSA
jgi:GH25 family lysozyme M1 (1,4-beta-N-acetylmuramidase)